MYSLVVSTFLVAYLYFSSSLTASFAVILFVAINSFPFLIRRRVNGSRYNLVVVGFGGAGACAALQAAETAAKAKKGEYKILILEKYNGGGATYRSGGVVYAGGGTAQQKTTGVKDTPENMFKYLKEELQDSVSDELLEAFTQSSADDIDWLRKQGVPINETNENAKCFSGKASMPPPEYTLYYSGSEKAAPFASAATPAQRGHMPSGARNAVGGGFHIFNALQKAVEREESVEVRTFSGVRSLLTNENDGGVKGVRVRTVEHIPFAVRMLYICAYTINSIAVIPVKPYDSAVKFLLDLIERIYGYEYDVLASDGAGGAGMSNIIYKYKVVLAAGGFCRNEAMVASIMPEYKGLFPLAPLGSDGTGILMGMNAGAGTSFMRSGASWKFMYPPFAFTKGILVNEDGKRICNEDVYGARLGKVTIEDNKGISWFIIDQTVYDEALKELTTSNLIPFAPKLQGYLNLYINRYKSSSILDLAKQCKIKSPETLQSTIEKYNNDCDNLGVDTTYYKEKQCLQSLNNAPFYAINYCSRNRAWFTPWLTMGGLKVDDKTGLVLKKDIDQVIPRLYAAGRNAAGIPSLSYVSGLSIADCVFTGRRAGRHAAQ